MGTNADKVRRSGRRALKVPDTARCACCGGALGLTKRGERFVCYRCLRATAGHRSDEAHHVFGRAVSPEVLRMDANLHRVLEDAKYAWPTLVNDPTVPLPARLLLMLLLTLRDLGRILLLYGQPLIEWLLDLCARLRAHHGPGWDQALGLRPLHRVV